MESRNLRWPSAKIRSNASVLLPEPLTPVTTTNFPRGMATERFFRLCSRAPWMEMASCADPVSGLAFNIGIGHSALVIRGVSDWARDLFGEARSAERPRAKWLAI